MESDHEYQLPDTKFEVTKKQNGEFQFYFRTDAGHVILASDVTYITRYDCIKGIDSVKYNCSKDSRFEFGISSTGKFYFSLRASNGKILGKSDLYESKDILYTAIGFLKNTAPEARIIEFD